MLCLSDTVIIIKIQNFERKAYSDEKTAPVAWLD